MHQCKYTIRNEAFGSHDRNQIQIPLKINPLLLSVEHRIAHSKILLTLNFNVKVFTWKF